MTLALDRATVRRLDADGRLHVAVTNISKANICGYYGSEIPDTEKLGLKPDQLYQLLRDPEELAKAASTFNNLPLLSEHVPVSAEEPRKDLTVGSTGTDAVFQAPYLKNSLAVWDQDAIDAIESGEQRELSCAYRYVADMTPGTYQGQPYDGVMREIRGNHVALVAVGRAGPDVVVGDSQPKEPSMPKKKKSGLTMALRPFLAADAAPKLRPIIAGLHKAEWATKKPATMTAIRALMAADADPEVLEKVIDALIPDEPIKAEDEDDGEGDPAAADGEWSEDDEKQYQALMARRPKQGADEADGDPPTADDDPDGKKDGEKSPPAQDAARIASDAEKSAVRRMIAIRDAEIAVRPIIGDLPRAMDSAAAVYRLALDHLQVDCKGVHPSAYPALLKVARSQSDASSKPKSIGMDGAASSALAARFPKAALLKR